MKTLSKIVLIGLAVLSTISVTEVKAQKVLDKPWIKENTPTRRVIPYTHVREADVMWHRRVWRQIDLREKINHPLYYFVTSK